MSELDELAIEAAAAVQRYIDREKGMPRIPAFICNGGFLRDNGHPDADPNKAYMVADGDITEVADE